MQAHAVVPTMSSRGLSGAGWSGLSTVPRDLSPQQRWALALSVLVAHGIAAWLVARAHPAPAPAQEQTPIMVELIAPVQAPPVVAPARPQPPVPVERPKVAPPKPVLSSRAPSRNLMEVPEPVRQPVVEAPDVPVPPTPTPAAVASVAAPAASAVTAPLQQPEPQPPKQVSISSLRYAVPPPSNYPRVSANLGESGVVQLKVQVDVRGRAADVQVIKSSGYSRLDQAALSAMKAARFIPYMEDGVPRSVVATTEIRYDLSD